VIPLIQFTNSRERMGKFANPAWVRVLAWMAAGLILSLNIWLVVRSIGEWLQRAGSWRPWLEIALIALLGALIFLLVWIIFQPVLPRWIRRLGLAPVELPKAVAMNLHSPLYQKILVPVDHTELDRDAIAHAAALAKQYQAKLYLLHVEEDVTSQVYGNLASTAEVEAGEHYLGDIIRELQGQQISADAVVRYSRSPRREIVRYARELKPDLVVMGAHGHKGLKDIIFGTTINAVRHKLEVPLLVVRRRA